MKKENTIELIRRPEAPTWLSPLHGRFPNASILLDIDKIELDGVREITFTVYSEDGFKTPFCRKLRFGKHALDMVIETDEIDDSEGVENELEPTDEVKYKRYVLDEYLAKFGFPASFKDLKIISWGMPSYTTLYGYMSVVNGVYSMTNHLAEEWLLNAPQASIANALGETNLSNWMVKPKVVE